MVVLLLSVATSAWAQEKKESKPTQPTEVSEPTELFGIPISGFISAKYRARWNQEDQDHDLYQYAALDIGDPLCHPVTAHVMIRTSEDLDGNSPSDGFYSFDEISDTYSSSFYTRFYYGYLDFHGIGFLETARLGRQFIQETPVPLYFDGARVDSTPIADFLHAQVGIYGGIPVHLFESSPRGDYLFGAYAQVLPWKGARVRVDYTRAQDDYLFGTQADDVFAFAIWQYLGEKVQLHYRHTILESESREQLARFAFQDPESDFRFEVSVYQLFEEQRAEAIEFDTYTAALQQYSPYYQVRLLVSKGIGEYFIIDAGLDVRELAHEGDEGAFNREFRRLFLATSSHDWLLKGLSLTLNFELWEVPASENGDIFSAGFDITQKCSETFKTSIGTAYSYYKYDYYANLEKQDVRSAYVKLAWTARKDLKIDLGMEYEYSRYSDNDDLENTFTLKVGVTQSF